MYLTDLSPRDAKWEEIKPVSKIVANAYAGTVYDKYSGRMQDCSGWLNFALVPTDTDEQVHKLQAAHLCHVRHCPVCQWRRSLMWRSRIFRAMRRILTDYPGKRFLFVTLTVKNCDVSQLGETLTHMNESWQRLVKRKEFPAIGWLRTVEVTRGKDGTAHPHFHALLMVNPSYFTKYYVKHEKWVQICRECFRLNYDPWINIQTVKPQNNSTTVTSESSNTNLTSEVQPIDEGLVRAIRYTLKYSVKPDDFLSHDTSVSQDIQNYQNWLIAITEQMHKRRMVSLGGIFKTYLAESDPTNLIVDNESLDTSETEENDTRITYVWRDEMTKYLLTA